MSTMRRLATIVLSLLCGAAPLSAEDGYDLWLRYVKVADAARLAAYRVAVTQLVVAGDSPTMNATRDELTRGLRGLLGVDIAVANAPSRDGVVIVGTPRNAPAIAALSLGAELRRAGD